MRLSAAEQILNIKILSLERWQLALDEKSSWPTVTEIEPIFDRNGQYYNRKTKYYWFEVDGKAYHYDSGKHFLYNLDLLNHKHLRLIEESAIKELIKGRICPKELAERYYQQLEIRYLRQIKLNTWKAFK